MDLLDSFCRALDGNNGFAYIRTTMQERGEVVVVAERAAAAGPTDTRWFMASLRENGIYIEEAHDEVTQGMILVAQQLMERVLSRPAVECDCRCGHCPCCEYGCMCPTRR
jgi:hypothetical protein